MNNRDVAAIFEEMATLSEILGGDPFRVRAFRRIHKVLSTLGASLLHLLASGDLARDPAS